MNDEINKSTYNSLRKHIGLPEVNRNEIKEILNWLKDEDIYIEDYGYQYKRISLKETKQLLDYITNLQQDTEMYAQLKDEYEEEITQLTNNWNELEEWIKQNSWYYNTSDGCQWVDQFKLLDKMKEIKEGKDND